MYRVVKNIDFCYGHRLTNYEGKCRHLHGHNARVEIEVSGDGLDGRGMLTDFGDIKRVMKKWIDDELDHKMILKADDPVVALLRESGETYFTIEDNPTAEAIAKLIFRQARALEVPVSEVRLWETPDSCATYREQPK